MKKLLVVAAVALAAAVSQAAAVTWTVNNIQSSPNVAVGAGWLVQIYAADVSFSYDAAKAGSITALDSAASVASGTIFKATNTFGDYAANAAVNTYAVIYDAATVDAAKNYIVSAELDKTVNAMGSPLTISFGNMAGTTTTNYFRNSDWVAVPEPTSGLLMLLGMAGLALRRRRA